MKKLFYFMLLFSFVIANSCNDATILGTPEKEKTKQKNIDGRLLSIPEDLEIEDITGEIIIINKSFETSSYLDSAKTVQCLFYDYSESKSADAGTLTINSTVIPRYVIPLRNSPTDTSYSYFLNHNFNYTGSYYNFSATGSNSYSSFSFTLKSPGSLVAVSSPSAYSQISNSDSLVVTWSGSHDSTNNVIRISLMGESGSAKGGGWYYTTDTGTYTIPSEDLSGFASGEKLTLCVDCATYKFHEVVGGKYVLAVISTSNEIELEVE